MCPIPPWPLFSNIGRIMPPNGLVGAGRNRIEREA